MKKLLSPLRSWDILKTFWILYWQIKFVFVWSTSTCHHVNPPVSAVVKCKIVVLFEWLHCSLVLFDVIFVKRPRMLPVQFVTLYKTCKPVNLNLHHRWRHGWIIAPDPLCGYHYLYMPSSQRCFRFYRYIGESWPFISYCWQNEYSIYAKFRTNENSKIIWLEFIV